LSYHRHYDIDLILITQNKNLINKKYLAFIDTMYVAYPSSKRLFSTRFRYKKYASYQEYHSNIMGTESLKLSSSVFSLYSSGSNKLGKTNVKSLFLPILILIFIVSISFYFLINQFSSHKSTVKSPVKNNNDINISRKVSINKKPILNNSFSDPDNNLFYVSCFSDSCVFKHSNTSFDSHNLFKIINIFKCKIIFDDNIALNYKTYVLSCNTGFNKFLQLFKNSSSESKIEKNNPNSANPVNLLSK